MADEKQGGFLEQLQSTVMEKINQVRQVSEEKKTRKKSSGEAKDILKVMSQEVNNIRDQVQARKGQDEQSQLDRALARIEELEQEVKKAQVEAEAEEEDAAMNLGANAWVRKAGGQGLNRRDAAGINSTVLDSLAIGTQVTLLEGPQPADGYTWWRVRASDGREGWVAGEELVPQPE